MLRVFTLLWISSGLLLCFGFRAPREGHWLDERVSVLPDAEAEKRAHFYSMMSYIDENNDTMISFKELHDVMHNFGVIPIGESGLKRKALEEFFVGEPRLMEPIIFDDMWWIMTRDEKEESEDYAETFFKYVDRNADKFVDQEELTTLVINGGRTNRTPQPKTKYHRLMEVFDTDKSQGLDRDEVFGKLQLMIKSIDDWFILTWKLGEMLQGASGLTKEELDCDKLARCMDADDSGATILGDDDSGMLELLDRNFNGEMEEHELKDLDKDLDECVRQNIKIGTEKAERQRAIELANEEL